MIPQITQEKLNALADQYARQLLNQVKEVLSQPAYHNSGELEESLKISITKATATEAPVILLTYADQGFFIGYKNPQWTSLPNVDKIKKWALIKTLSIGDIPGYTYGTAPNITDEKKIERIAWAIAKNKRKEDTWKQKKWKNASGLGDLLRSLNENTIKAWIKDVETILAESITTGAIMS